MTHVTKLFLLKIAEDFLGGSLDKDLTQNICRPCERRRPNNDIEKPSRSGEQKDESIAFCITSSQKGSSSTACQPRPWRVCVIA